MWLCMYIYSTQGVMILVPLVQDLPVQHIVWPAVVHWPYVVHPLVYVLLILVVVVLSLTPQGTVLVSIHLAVSLCGVVSVCNYLYSYDHTFVVACAAGCRACTGPNNADCLQCEDDNRYRVTTNQPASSACVTANECVTPAISTFGDRTCNMVRSTSQGVSLRYGTRIVNILIVCNVFCHREVLAPSNIINFCWCFCCWFTHSTCETTIKCCSTFLSYITNFCL